MHSTGLLIILSGSHRQAGTAWFSVCLDRIRVGTVTDADLVMLKSTSAGVSDELWSSRTQLRALNRQVDAFHEHKMRMLLGADTVSRCQDQIDQEATHPGRRAYAAGVVKDLAPPRVTLKPCAVISTTRAVDGVATGTQGVVNECRFRPAPDSVACTFGGGSSTITMSAFDLIDNRNQRLAPRFAMPLTLAWAMAVHRSQGTTQDTLAIDFSDLNWREEGLVYTAVSRCRLFQGLFVKGLRREYIAVCEEARSFYEP